MLLSVLTWPGTFTDDGDNAPSAGRDWATVEASIAIISRASFRPNGLTLADLEVSATPHAYAGRIALRVTLALVEAKRVLVKGCGREQIRRTGRPALKQYLGDRGIGFDYEVGGGSRRVDFCLKTDPVVFMRGEGFQGGPRR
jgi:hypothetical protein